MAGWMNTPLGTEVDLGTGHIVLDVVAAVRERGTASPLFSPMSIVAKVAHLRLSATAELLCESLKGDGVRAKVTSQSHAIQNQRYL